MKEEFINRIKKYTLYFCLFLLVYLVVFAISWFMESTVFIWVLPGSYSMSLVSTIFFILLLSAFVLHQASSNKYLSCLIPNIFSLLVLVASLAILGEVILQLFEVTDTLTLVESFEQYTFRSPPLSALTFVSISIALFLFTSDQYKKHQMTFVICLAIPFLLSFLTILGYALGLKYFLGFTGIRAIALNSSIVFIFLALVIFVNPEERIQFSIPLKRKMLIIFIPFLLISFGFTVYTFRSLQKQKADAELVEHTLLVQRQLNQLHIDIEDLSESYHSIIFFENRDDHKDFTDARQNIEQEIDLIDSLVSDSRAQRDLLPKLRESITGYISYSEKMIAAYRDQTSKTVQGAEIWTQENKRMAVINELLFDMFIHEEDLLSLRSQEFERSANITKFVVASGSLFSSLLLLFLYTVFRSDYRVQIKNSEEIKRERDFARNIISTIADSLLVLDSELRVKEINPSFCRTFGLEADSIVGSSIYEAGNGEWDIPEIKNLLEEVIPEKHSCFNYEVYFENINNSSKTFLINCTLINDKSDENKLILLVASDITARKQYETQLKEYGDELSDLYNKAPVGYHSLDKDGVIIRINDMTLGWLGYTREEVISKMKFDDLLTDEESEAFRTSFEEFKKTGHIRDMEHELIRKDGTVFNVVVNATAITDEEGNYVASRSTVVDITDRKRIENEMQELNKSLKEREEMLENANKELEAFSYSVSHDLRAPLRHINGFIKLLKSKSTDFDETALKYFNIISDSAQLMGKLIDDLLSFSRIGRAELNKTDVDANSIIEKIISTLRPEIKDRDIEWKVDELPEVYADEGLLYSVFANLISNAVKYTGKEEKAVIEVSSDRQDGKVIFAVKDNGTGFDMKYVDKLFGVFQRLHSSSEFEGTGIGLALIRRIIMKHGGLTWAEGKVGEGANFYFTLPQKEIEENDE